MSASLSALPALRTRTDALGHWLAPLGLRLLLAWEFFESGLEKWRGENWFASVQASFPWPIRALPAELNWQLATWAELGGALCLLLGLATRSAAALLIGVTVVATAAVHWPEQWDSLGALAQGYAISDQGQGNFKLPLLFIVMLLPLLLNGGGRLSVDAWLAGRLRWRQVGPDSDLRSWGVLALAAAWPVSWLLPGLGAALLVCAMALLACARRPGRAERSAKLDG